MSRPSLVAEPVGKRAVDGSNGHVGAQNESASASSLLTAQEVAQLLGVPVTWVYARSRRGRIRPVTLGATAAAAAKRSSKPEAQDRYGSASLHPSTPPCRQPEETLHERCR